MHLLSMEDNLKQFVENIKLNKNVGSVSAFVDGSNIALMIHFRHEDDPIPDIPDDAYDDNGVIIPELEEIYSGFNRMILHHITLINGTFDLDTEIKRLCPQRFQVVTAKVT